MLHAHTCSYPATCHKSPDVVRLHRELLCWSNQGSPWLDQTSLLLPHHLDCSWDPCVTRLGIAARSPSKLLQESYYLYHHGLSDGRSGRNHLNRKKWRKLRRRLPHMEYSWGKWCYSRAPIQKLNSYLLFQKYIALLYIFHKWYRILHMFRFYFCCVSFFKEGLFSMLPPSSQTHTKDSATGLCSFFSPFKTHHTNRVKHKK